MSDNQKSFWSSIPGLITGLAGLLTGIVGLVTLAVQQGVIGSSSDKPATTTTVVVSGGPTGSGGTSGGGGGATATTEAGTFAATPSSLTFGGTEREKAVKVQNSSASAIITVLTPSFSGTDLAAFKTDAGCSNTRLAPGASCTLKVLFTPAGLLKKYSASLVLKAEGAPRVTEVPIDASGLL